MHEITIHYTTDDDGIWLWCNDCGWEHNLGFGPDVETAIVQALEHRKDVRRGPQA